MVKIVGWLQKHVNFRKTETRKPLCRKALRRFQKMGLTKSYYVPNLSGILFPLVYSGFRRFLICFTYSLTLLFPLFPGTPAPSVVIYVVKNASRPVSGEDSPVPDGKRFALLCGLYCNSGQAVMQEVSAGVTAQKLRRYKPAKKSSPN